MVARVRLVDIAEVAGVSVSLVSRVLTGRGEVAEATRVRVLSVAKELGYRPDHEPRGRPPLQRKLIDLALAQFDGPWSDEITAGALHAAAARGYDLVLTVERDDPEDDWPQRIRSHGSVGAIVGLIHPSSSQLTTLLLLGTPIVLLEERVRSPAGATSIGTTDRDGGSAAGAIIVRSGVDELIIMVGTPPYLFGRERVAGCVEAVARLAPDLPVRIVRTQWSNRAAEVEITPLLRAARGRIGIFACNDDFAFAVYQACHVAGRRIPEDVVVVGFDDVPQAAMMIPPLTTVHQPLREMAAMAVELIVGAHPGQGLPNTRIEVPAHLVERDSTGPRR